MEGMAKEWKKYLQDVVDSLVQDLVDLATNQHFNAFGSSTNGLEQRRKVRDARSLVTAFREIYLDHHYTALEQETDAPPIQSVETQAEVAQLFRQRKSALSGALRILNVKAEVVLDYFSENGMTVLKDLTDQLQKLKVLTLDDLKMAFESNHDPLTGRPCPPASED